MKEFYFVSVSMENQKTLEKIGPCNVLVNVAKKNLKYLIPHNKGKLFIDSGGFSFFTKFKNYPYSPNEYLLKIKDLKPDFFASMDIPCEPQIIKKRNSNIIEHIEITVDNQIKILELLSEINIDSTFVPVIQGWRVEDYLYCIDRMREQGLVSDYMAVGSVCRRHQNRELRRIILSIARELPKVKLHAFGVKISVLKDKHCFNALYSCDSASWHFEDMFTISRKKFSHEKSNTKRSYLVAKDWKEKLEKVVSRNKEFWESQLTLACFGG